MRDFLALFIVVTFTVTVAVVLLLNGMPRIAGFRRKDIVGILVLVAIAIGAMLILFPAFHRAIWGIPG